MQVFYTSIVHNLPWLGWAAESGQEGRGSKLYMEPVKAGQSWNYMLPPMSTS